MKKTEETPGSQPSLPPGLEGAAAAAAAGASSAPAAPAPAPETPKDEPKQEAAPSLKKKEDAKAAAPVMNQQEQGDDDGPGLVGGIGAIFTFAAAACAMVFFALVLLNFLL